MYWNCYYSRSEALQNTVNIPEYRLCYDDIVMSRSMLLSYFNIILLTIITLLINNNIFKLIGPPRQG